MAEKGKTVAGLMMIDLHKDSNLRHPKDVDIYHSTKTGLKHARDLPGVLKFSDRDAMTFRSEYRDFLVGMLDKILERCPLKYPVTRGMSCLSPQVMMKPEKAVKRLEVCIGEFMAANRMTGTDADQVSEDYKKIIHKPQVMLLLEKFKPETDRLDDLFVTIFNLYPDLSKPFKDFVKSVLIMFHGNAEVERGFNINKECLLTNLHEKSIVAKRRINAEVAAVGGDPKDVKITPSMINNCKHAKQAADADREKNKKEKSGEIAKAAKKRQLTLHLQELEAKKAREMSEADRDINDLQMELKQLNKM